MMLAVTIPTTGVRCRAAASLRRRRGPRGAAECTNVPPRTASIPTRRPYLAQKCCRASLPRRCEALGCPRVEKGAGNFLRADGSDRWVHLGVAYQVCEGEEVGRHHLSNWLLSVGVMFNDA
ncbi:hypothetical protein EJB05_35131, partial [Eragrostis curvula]